jgi:hypothetical protein
MTSSLKGEVPIESYRSSDVVRFPKLPDRLPSLRDTRLVFALAMRRQLVVAVIAAICTGVEFGGMALCLLPVVFVWSSRAYRIAAGALAVFLSWCAIVFATGVGLPSFVPHWFWMLPVAATAWLTVWPIRTVRDGELADSWTFAGVWPASAARRARWVLREEQRIRDAARKAARPHARSD